MVNAIKSIRFIIAVTCSIFCIWAQYSFAKTYIYFMEPGGKIIKLDTDTNTTKQLVFGGGKINSVLGSDMVNNHLFISYCVRLGPCTVGVYDLTTLKLLKKLPIVAPRSDMQLVIHPDGSKFLINYLLEDSEDMEGGGYTTDLYDAKTLTEIKNIGTPYGLYQVMFSKDEKKFYSIISGDEARLDTIDSTTYQIISSKDLTQLWRKRPDVFSSGIKGYGSGKILIYENVKPKDDLPNKLDLYVYDIETQNVSTKISTGLEGNAMLSPDGTKIIFDENQAIREMKDGESQITGFRSLGKIHIYDVSTGKELRMISLKVQGKGKIRGIRSAGDRLYYQSEGLSKDTTNITVLDIKNYTLITTISIPFKVLTAVFFEQ